MSEAELPTCPGCGNSLPAAASEESAASATSRWPHFPFCSNRCKLLDLNTWLTGGYVIPGQPVDVEDDPGD